MLLGTATPAASSRFSTSNYDATLVWKKWALLETELGPRFPFTSMSSAELLEVEMPPRPGAASGGTAPLRRSRPPHQTGPAFDLLPPFGKIGVCANIQQEHVNAAVDSVLRYMATNPEEAVSSVLSASYRLPRIAPILARVVSTVAAADEDFHAAVVTR
jgi:hypothetical protein